MPGRSRGEEGIPGRSSRENQRTEDFFKKQKTMPGLDAAEVVFDQGDKMVEMNCKRDQWNAAGRGRGWGGGEAEEGRQLGAAPAEMPVGRRQHPIGHLSSVPGERNFSSLPGS